MNICNQEYGDNTSHSSSKLFIIGDYTKLSNITECI
jgi:hypothetical protein